MPTIKIDSILGGHSPTTSFARKDQFRASIGIDPAQPINDNNPTATGTIASGLLRPTAAAKISGTTVANAPLWFAKSPKDSLVYVYDFSGSAYSINAALTSVTALADGGTLSSSTGNGCEYYDNYIYFAKNTDIARYGPLNGAPTFTGTFWTGTLAKTALSNTTYPTFDNQIQLINYPNHILHRHSDGRLYIGDVVSNQGTIHYIATKNVAVEGDTDDGSTYNKVQVGYGLWPTAMESYGTDLVIAFFEGNTGLSGGSQRAKIAFWDTISAKVNKITWVEFPDTLITAMKNINGVLYVASGSPGPAGGFRISRFVGGYTFQEVDYIEDGRTPLHGSLDGDSKRLLFGSLTYVPETQPSVFSYGLQKAALGQRIFNVMGATGGSTAVVTSLFLPERAALGYNTPVIGWTTGASGGSTNGIDYNTASYGAPASVWWSQLYKIGQPFQIKRIRIPMAQAVAANMIITPTLYVDDGTKSQILTTINNTNFSNSEVVANIRTDGTGSSIISGKNNFWLALRWSGTALAVVGFPILIDFELIPD